MHDDNDDGDSDRCSNTQDLQATSLLSCVPWAPVCFPVLAAGAKAAGAPWFSWNLTEQADGHSS